MQAHSEAEFFTDLRVAVAQYTKTRERQQAIEWQVGRSIEQDLKILNWLVSLEYRWSKHEPCCRDLIQALVNSPTLGVQRLLQWYLQNKLCFKAREVVTQMQDVLFWVNTTVFLKQFASLDVGNRFALLSEVVTSDSYGYHFSLEVCRLAEFCDWGVLHRLKPWCSRFDEYSEMQAIAEKWHLLLLTYKDIYHQNDIGAS